MILFTLLLLAFGFSCQGEMPFANRSARRGWFGLAVRAESGGFRCLNTRVTTHALTDGAATIRATASVPNAIVLMPVGAVSLLSVHGRCCLAAQNIGLASDRFKVRRIAAVSHSTQVIDFESGRDWANELLIGNAMRATAASVYAKRTISSSVACTNPIPAFGSWIDSGFCPEACGQSFVTEIHNLGMTHTGLNRNRNRNVAQTSKQ